MAVACVTVMVPVSLPPLPPVVPLSADPRIPTAGVASVVAVPLPPGSVLARYRPRANEAPVSSNGALPSRDVHCRRRFYRRAVCWPAVIAGAGPW